MNQFNIMLDYVMRAAVEYNRQNRLFHGVLFHAKTLQSPTSAIVASSMFAVEIENVNTEVKGEFFSYIEKENPWMPSPYPAPADRIFRAFSNAKVSGSLIVAVPDLVNHLNKIPIEMKKKSRVIFTPGKLDATDIPLKFGIENGVFVSRRKSSPKSYIPVNGPYPPGFENHFHRCRVVNETEENIFVEVLEIFGKLKIGIKYSPKAYIPEDRAAINNLIDIPIDLIMTSNVPGPWYDFEPIHFDCIMLFDVIKILTFVQATHAELSFGWYLPEPTQERPAPELAPVMLAKNVKRDSLDRQVNIIIAGLRQEFGPQRR